MRETGGGLEELREGIAWEGRGEVNVMAMAREKRFGMNLGVRFGSLGMVLVWVWEETVRGRWPRMKVMIFIESSSIHSLHHDFAPLCFF